MAWIEQFFLNLGFLTSDRKQPIVQLRVDETEGLIWLNAIPGVVRDATEIGVLITAIEAVSNATLLYEEVCRKTVNDAAVYPAPSTEFYSFDKFGISYAGGINNYQFTIPARKMSVVVPDSDGVTIPISGGSASAEVLALVAAVNDTVIAKNGSAAVVTGMRVVS